MFEPQKSYQEVYPEPTMESTKDDEIPVDVADTGQSILAESAPAPKGFPYCRHSSRWIRVDLVFSHGETGTYAQTPVPRFARSIIV